MNTIVYIFVIVSIIVINKKSICVNFTLMTVHTYVVVRPGI